MERPSIFPHAFFILLLCMFMLLEDVHGTGGRYDHPTVHGSRLQNGDKRLRLRGRERPGHWKRRIGILNRRWSRGRKTKTKKNIFGGHDLIFPSQFIDFCCPTVYEIIEPMAGRNRTGYLVDLYQDGKTRQQFYEVSCHPKVIDKPCKFIEGRNSKMSRCVQDHSLTYALVRPVGDEDHPWLLDYIRIRSGCTCHVLNLGKMNKELRL